MTKNIDWTGLKFKLIEELGDSVDIYFIKFDHDNYSIYSISHSQADGASGFAQVLNQVDGLNVSTLPCVKESNRGNICKRLYYAVKHLILQSPVEYKFINKVESGKNKFINLISFSPSESKILEDYAVKKSININSLFLDCLDKIIVKNFLVNDSARKWMLPVNIRRKKYSKYLKGNFVTALTIKTNSSSTEVSIYKQIRTHLKSGIIWGGWIVANAPKFFGVKKMRKMTQSLKSPYIGFCTNLGKWPLDKEKVTKSNHIWGLSASPNKFTPVSLSILEWDSRITIGLEIHKSLAIKNKPGNQILEELLEKICEKVNQKLSPKKLVIDKTEEKITSVPIA